MTSGDYQRRATPGVAPAGDRWALISDLIRLACGPAEGELTVLASAPPEPEGDGQFDWAATFPGSRVLTAAEGDFAELLQRELTQGSTVLAVPPWGRRSASGPSLHLEESTLLSVNATGGALSALLPAGALSRAGSSFRQQLSRAWTPATIVELAGLPGIHATFEAALICFVPTASPPRQTRFLRIPRGSFDGQIVNELRGLLRRDGGASANGYVLRRALVGGERWSFAAHDPSTEAHIQELPGFGSAMRLGDVYEVLQANERGELLRERQRIVAGRSIRPDGSVQTEDEPLGGRRVTASVELVEGDLVMRGVVSGGVRLVVGAVGPAVLPARASQHVLVLRPRNEAAREAGAFTAAYLRSAGARAQLDALSTSGLHVSPWALSRVLIPVPDGPLRDAFEELRAAERLLNEWATGAAEVVRAAFEQPSVGQARRHIIKSGRLLRQRTEAAQLLDDASHTYATRYPQPIAIRWSVAANRRMRGDHDGYIREALRCYETVLAYAATVGMALARSRGVDLKVTRSLRDMLARGQGPTLGTWRAVLQELATRKGGGAEEGGALGELGNFLAVGTPAEAASKALADRRNDEAHLRASVEVDRDAAAVSASLEVIMRSAAFLVDLAPIHVDQVSWDALRGVNSLEVQHLVGDRAVIPFEKVVAREPSIETGSLYVADHEQGLFLLRPYLLRARCPECHAVSTFHLDRDLGDQLRLKSLEDGHVLESADKRPFEAVGLLGG